MENDINQYLHLILQTLCRSFYKQKNQLENSTHLVSIFDLNPLGLMRQKKNQNTKKNTVKRSKKKKTFKWNIHKFKRKITRMKRMLC